jgi:hypothetical protein
MLELRTRELETAAGFQSLAQSPDNTGELVDIADILGNFPLMMGCMGGLVWLSLGVKQPRLISARSVLVEFVVP